MTKKPKMGRPKKPQSEKLTATVLSKVLPKERKAFIAKAKSQGLKLSAHVRKVLNEDLAK